MVSGIIDCNILFGKALLANSGLTACSIDANKENMISATQNADTSIEVSSNTTANNSNILSNEDNTVPKNSKEKTPMCLVNELARYNKVRQFSLLLLLFETHVYS